LSSKKRTCLIDVIRRHNYRWTHYRFLEHKEAQDDFIYFNLKFLKNQWINKKMIATINSCIYFLKLFDSFTWICAITLSLSGLLLVSFLCTKYRSISLYHLSFLIISLLSAEWIGFMIFPFFFFRISLKLIALFEFIWLLLQE